MAAPITGETWGDEVDGVRVFLREEAEQPFSVLRPKVEEAHRTLTAALAGVSDHQAEFRPATGEGEDAWGIVEVLRHVVSVELMMADRLRALGSGIQPQLRTTYPGYMEDVDTRRLPELAIALTGSRENLLAAIAEIEGHERLDMMSPHRRFGELNCRGWMAMHTLHLQDHARQIEKIKEMDGFPAA
jgi:hypothetical protein